MKNNNKLLKYFWKNQIRLNLGKGEKNALTRSELKMIASPNDRTNRYMIDELRLEGVPIMSNSQSSGYWLAERKSEVTHYAKEMRKRAHEHNLRADIAERWARENESELINDEGN